LDLFVCARSRRVREPRRPSLGSRTFGDRFGDLFGARKWRAHVSGQPARYVIRSGWYGGHMAGSKVTIPLDMARQWLAVSLPAD
jgi:hypothetical protein